MKEPIRCFEGATKPYERFWKLRNAEETGSEPEIEFYGYISEYSWLDDDITPKLFKDDLYAIGNGGPITIRMNSGGGDVIAASVIRAIMTDYPGHITVRIDGLAASAAVAVATAAKTVKIQDSAYMMIHDPAFAVFWATLDIDTLSQWLDALKTFKDGIINAYQSRTGLSKERLAKMMSAETWMTAADAVALGFADQVISGQKSSNSIAAVTNALRNYVNVPAALRADNALLQSTPVTQVAEESPEIKRLRAEVKLIA